MKWIYKNLKNMKKLFVLTAILFASFMEAQEQKQNTVPQISVTGEGKIKVTPDQVSINIGAESTGKDAGEVKKKNDEIIASIVKVIKKYNIPASDYQTTNVNLYRNYDYEKKKHHFVASQTLTVLLKDLKKYNEFMMSLNDTGITNINGVDFKSSKMEDYERDARRKAMQNAKMKAEDYVLVLNQKIGKALYINDNSSVYYPQPRMYKAEAMAMDAGGSAPETLAPGEIEITANVQVTFVLE